MTTRNALMKSTLTFVSLALLGASTVAPASEKPQFHPLWVPAGKSAGDTKPRSETRTEEPVVLELRAHRHADGSLHYQCDHLHEPSPPARQAQPEGDGQ